EFSPKRDKKEEEERRRRERERRARAQAGARSRGVWRRWGCRTKYPIYTYIALTLHRRLNVVGRVVALTMIVGCSASGGDGQGAGGASGPGPSGGTEIPPSGPSGAAGSGGTVAIVGATSGGVVLFTRATAAGRSLEWFDPATSETGVVAPSFAEGDRLA